MTDNYDELLLSAAQIGDIEFFKEFFHSDDPELVKDCMCTAARGGHENIVDWICANYNGQINPAKWYHDKSVTEYFANVVKWIVHQVSPVPHKAVEPVHIPDKETHERRYAEVMADLPDYKRYVVLTAIHLEYTEYVKNLFKDGYPFDGEMIIAAIHTKNYALAKWLLTEGCSLLTKYGQCCFVETGDGVIRFSLSG